MTKTRQGPVAREKSPEGAKRRYVPPFCLPRRHFGLPPAPVGEPNPPANLSPHGGRLHPSPPRNQVSPGSDFSTGAPGMRKTSRGDKATIRPPVLPPRKNFDVPPAPVGEQPPGANCVTGGLGYLCSPQRLKVAQVGCSPTGAGDTQKSAPGGKTGGRTIVLPPRENFGVPPAPVGEQPTWATLSPRGGHRPPKPKT